MARDAAKKMRVLFEESRCSHGLDDWDWQGEGIDDDGDWGGFKKSLRALNVAVF